VAKAPLPVQSFNLSVTGDRPHCGKVAAIPHNVSATPFHPRDAPLQNAFQISSANKFPVFAPRQAIFRHWTAVTTE
jgi:hypothetical protein